MLTPKIVKNLKPRKKRFQISDSCGLVIRVQKSGLKSWVLRIPKNGRVIDLTLGHYPEISLAQARSLARKKRIEFDLTPPKSITFKDAFSFWCSKKKFQIKSYKEEKRRLEKYIVSKIGWASGAITDDDAETGTSSAISTDPVTATQLFNFSANRSNQVFGASGTVQPSAMRALVLIRAF